MKSISKLKDEARRYEQREEWEKAIQAYLQVLRTADEGEAEVELPLYNRVGDLCVRLGKPQEAVRHYEQAADRYAEAGLYNNAIALCNKALRYSPDRLELIRKLGQFSASQGFITDARRYFLDYAERQFKAGKVSEALSALEDFANVSDDADVREMLGRQLKAHGRINDAVDELRRAHALRMRDGQTQQADAIREEILAIDPSASIDGGVAAPAGGGPPRAGAALPGLVDIETERPDPEPTEDAAPGAVPGLETGALPDDDHDADSIRLTGFETTGQPDLADIDVSGSGEIEGLETTSFDFGDVAADTPGLEDLGLQREENSFDGPTDGDSEVFDLPTLDDPPGGFDLPTLDEPEPTTDLPTLDEPGGMADLPLLDDAHGSTDLPDTSDGEVFDLPLLGDDDADDLSRDEAAPATPPGIDNEPSRDVPAANRDDFLGGDLPLDLNSLGGSGSFDLTVPDEDAADAPAWTDEPAFDLPDLDGDALGLPTWEPESDPSFDLPSFDTGVEDAPDAPADQDAASIDERVESAEAATPLEQPPAAAEPAGGAVDAAPPVEREPPGPEAADAAEPGLDIPAIELPTWDTPSTPGAEADAAGAIDEDDIAEPAWVESSSDEEEEASPELPTFTYEDDSPDDDVAEVDDVVSSADQTAADADDDSDPLGLAAHLAGRVGAGIAPPTRAVPEPAEAPEPTQPTDDDWLSYIAEDDAAADVEPAPDEGPALDESTDDTESGEDVSAPPATIEDVAAEAARADEAARDMAAASPPAPEPPPPAAEPPAPAAPGGARSEGYIDLGALVTGDGEEESTRFRVQETAPTGDEDRDFAELLSQFKAKVQEHLPPEDAAAHYDLGLAFKEMGLIDEAIGEFQVALRAGHMRLRVYEELGQCFLQKEQFNIAEKVLSRALTMKFDDELELLGVYYHLGRAYEALGRRDQARDAYERVLGMDINFGDVTDRLARL